MSDLLLEFSGPYRCVNECAGDLAAYSLYRHAPRVGCCGIYLQAVRLDGVFRVSYVGRAACFAKRLPGEFRDWLTGKDTRRGQTLELDPGKYCQGVRSYEVVPTDHSHMLRLRKEVLECTVVFLADLPGETSPDVQERIEGALMRHLKRCAAPVADFLYNQPAGKRRFSGTIEVRAPGGMRVEGLETAFSDV